MELTLRELELLITPNNAQKKEKKTKNVSNNMLNILQKYVFEMQGNDTLPMKYQNKQKNCILSN